MQRRIKLSLQYDGSAYCGWQIQPSGTSIQGILQDRLYEITGEKVAVIGAGRTDAGVHAVEQIAAFDSHSSMDAGIIKRALNALLPQDIRVMEAIEAADNFHPRYNALSKRYFYIIANMRDIPVFIRKYVWQVTAWLNVAAMDMGASHLLGSHDFSSFRGSGCGAENPVRSVRRLDVVPISEITLFTGFQGSFIKIAVEADGFLRHMVRNIVGTLVEVGRGKIGQEKIEEILKSKDRRSAGPTAPPQGLFLEKVIY
jgi:tRNA pseudouridine38-40 synthase